MGDVPRDEEQMAAVLVDKGPFSLAVDAGMWTSYTGGILTNCPSGTPSHGVLVVGFGMEGAQKYWLIKNSWGHGWGESGYIRLAFGSNQCSVTYRPVMALVDRTS